ncbi:hypothetical protein BC941DRAFT_416073 [Chlamydoabsidia padenii]|nr:hypothetical protein BC941DRAFT_416073 [Chlamydoabsidia padenii]
MNTNYLQRLSFHKLEVYQPSESLHSFVLVRNSLLQSIRTQQQQDSWLDACFDELTPTTVDLTLGSDEPIEKILMDGEDKYDTENDIDMLLLEEDSEEEDDGPVSPEESSLQPPSYRSIGPAFFIPMDDEDDDAILAAPDNHHHPTQHSYGSTDGHHKLGSFLSV